MKKNLKDYIVNSIAKDYEFINHVVDTDIEYPVTGKKYSHIIPLIRRLEDKITAREIALSIVPPNMYEWIAFLLLPIGIGLRLVKTSLELFGNLDRDVV